MSAFQDMSRFFEQRLDEFLKSHPDLELQILEDQLREQAEDAQKRLQRLTAEDQQVQQAILQTAQDVQRWHERIAKADQSQRPDLAQAAREREAALLLQGNQQWAQMSTIQQQIRQTQQHLTEISHRRQELEAKIRQERRRSPGPSTGSQATGTSYRSNSGTFTDIDPLEAKFKQWEMEAELEALKRKMGR
ncbi:MAG: TIGR04376 family protein [Thermosynechococcaceae cyanobacterium]